MGTSARPSSPTPSARPRREVTGVRTFVVGNPPPGFGGRYFIFVKLNTDDGISGIGEVYGATVGPQVVAA